MQLTLSRHHLSRRPDRQFQHFAQCAQVAVPWPTMIRFPEVDAALTDPHLFSKISRRQPALDPSFPDVAGEIGFACQNMILSMDRRHILLTGSRCKCSQHCFSQKTFTCA